ncbi:chorismate mutase [Synechococcales cyanobacterium C]|uniref:chorismate mutase n=1 Tax=Petrachloros mirabilis ULC683 TaxID=2781853 RepID=A0A8K1ZWT4_9CYAN|nr:chorismate mutase [Petrachloros mirabilis]NCJ05107.1 chorismate mutase [Petrachloros mirabilis ULC683]
MEEMTVTWRVRAIRGATTADENSVEAIRDAVSELLDVIEERNTIDLTEVVSVTFSVTRDLDKTFPAAIARERPHWESIPLLDVQQMYVPTDLPHCIRCLIHFNTPTLSLEIHHVYLRQAQNLRPDWGFVSANLPVSPLTSH